MSLKFSRRIPEDLWPGALAVLADQVRRAGGALLDLTGTDPAAAELPGEADRRAAIGAALADGARADHRPDPRGLPAARAAIAARHRLDPDQIVIAGSTAEAASLLFRLLCDPGDAVLIETPTDPRLARLAALDGLEVIRWRGPYRPIPASARALITTTPSIPTGACPDDAVVRVHDKVAARHQLAVIGDELFLDHAPGAVSVTAATQALAFSLGGLAGCGLPQLELGWIAVAGPRELRDAALARLALIAGACRAVATPLQEALPRLLEIGAGARAAIAARLSENRTHLAAAGLIPGTGRAGWWEVIPLPAGVDEEVAARALVTDAQIVVHPGWVFDLPGQHLVLSLLARPDQLAGAALRIGQRIEELRP